MRGIGADQPWLARRRIGQQVAADVTGGESQRPQARDLDVREVLADAAISFQHARQRGRDDGRCRVENEAPVDAVHQIDRAFQERPSGGKEPRASASISRESGAYGEA